MRDRVKQVYSNNGSTITFGPFGGFNQSGKTNKTYRFNGTAWAIDASGSRRSAM